jgi:transposase
MGEKSWLPIFQTVYSGSLKDVRTLQKTIEESSCYTGAKNLLLVMDKGFSSRKNVLMLLEKYPGYRFIMPVPFTMGFAKELVKDEMDTIDEIQNTIITGKKSVRGVRGKAFSVGA